MSGPRSIRPLSLLLSAFLVASMGSPLQAASSPTEALLRLANTPAPQTGTTGTGETPTGTPTTPTTTPPLPAIPPAPSQTPIRIGLGRSLTTGQTKTAQGLYILADERLVATAGPGAVITFSLTATGQVQIGGQVQPAPGATGVVPNTLAPVSGTIRLVPQPVNPPLANWIAWDDLTYRGQAEIKKSVSGLLTFINLINLEEYLYGVVPAEMPASWALEALKAQAVSARTFALKNLGSYPAEGFDMTDTTLDQAYGGVLKEHPNSTAAVQATTGEVVRYNGQLIETFYHASSGGHTEPVSFAWGGSPSPYLVGVPDYDNLPGNKYYQWSVDFTPAELQNCLLARGIDVGEIKSVTPASAPNYEGGRPPTWKITGTKGEKIIRGSELRTALGLLAAPRAVQVLTASGTPTLGGTPSGTTTGGSTTPAPQTVKVLGANGKLVERPLKDAVVLGAAAKTTTLDGTATAQGADGKQVAFQPPPPPPPAPPSSGAIATVRFDGGGWGHAIGLSQWGAYGMALQGKTYREILTHYYTGTKVERP